MMVNRKSSLEHVTAVSSGEVEVDIMLDYTDRKKVGDDEIGGGKLLY